MQWTFSWGWFFGGLAIAVAGLLMVKFYKQIADGIAGGLRNYEKVKLAGVLAVIGGFIFMSNLHTMLFYFIFHLIMPDKFP
jgi:hypothetical protein